MNETLVIEGLAGRRKLEGTINVSGAKNAALKALAATLLFSDRVTIDNVPDIEDIRRSCDLLKALGAVCEHKKHTYIVTAPKNANTSLEKNIAKRMRASIVFTGPVLARYGTVTFPFPGGCVIGERPIDIFLEGFKRMGARIVEKKGVYEATTDAGLSGADLFFRVQSVTATETFMMAAVLAKGVTTIRNAATEPEIEDLARFLNSCGARIVGAGTHTITITGGKLLRANGRAHTIMPDRIEAGSFLILAALVGKKVEIAKCNPAHIEAVTSALIQAGVPLEIKRDRIIVSPGNAHYHPLNIKTHEYPGFPTDLQAPMVVFLTQAKGESLVFETIFEGRLNYTESLLAMGGRITAMDTHRVLVRGKTNLRGKNLESPDLRAGLAFVIAAAIAKGTSVIHNVYNIDRGYERIEERLSAIGVDIKRVPA